RSATLAWPKRGEASIRGETQEVRATREDEEREHLRRQFASLTGPLAGAPSEALFELMWFHKREDKPRGWARFDRASREPDELIDDLESLGGLVALGPARREKRSQVRTYRYPEQETKLREGDDVKARDDRGEADLPTVTIARLDPETCEVDVKFGPKAGLPP